MVKKLLFFVFALFLLVNSVNGAMRDEMQALEIAKQFYNSHTVGGINKVSVNNRLSLSYTRKYKALSGDSIAALYVINQGDAGFIIVSANDATKQILGYSDETSFDIHQCPENLKSWLQFYTKEIAGAASLTASSSTITTSASSTAPTNISRVSQNLLASSISPLLGSIKWNQGSPYNNLCPIINSTTNARAVTGCVATAMAQVMKYYNWPVTGTGSNSYTTSTLKLALSLDFSQTTFDWANMTNTYSSSSTAIQQNAVATLMYNCGVAVNMNYNTSSGASTTKMGQALINNFGYDPNIQQYPRDYYTRDEFVTLIKTELNSARPVLFSGQTPENSGHEFVLDGYDKNGLFHINWGWGGMSNGYFEISALNPDSQGIGGSVGGYDLSQEITIGIQKPTSSSTPSYLLYMDNAPATTTQSTTKGSPFSVSLKDFFNRGLSTFSGSIGLGIYKDGVLQQTTGLGNVNALLAGYGWSSLSLNGSVNSSLSDGSYKLYVIYQPSGQSGWQIARGFVGTPNYLNITVNSNTVTLSSPPASSAVLTLNSLSSNGHLYWKKVGRLSLEVANSGEEYHSVIGVEFTSSSDNTATQTITVPVDIAKGEVKTIELSDTIKLAPGTYTLTALYDLTNRYSESVVGSSLGTPISVSVSTAPTETPNLTLTSLISFPDNKAVDKSNAVLSATIKNTTGFFDGKVVAFIFNSSGVGTSLAYIGYQNAIFDVGEQKTLSFTGPIDLANGSYIIAVYYYTGSTWTQITPTNYSALRFTITDVATGLETAKENGIGVFPNPVGDVLNVASKYEMTGLKLTDMSGRVLLYRTETGLNDAIPVNNLSKGMYILRIDTQEGSFTSKIIKQ